MCPPMIGREHDRAIKQGFGFGVPTNTDESAGQLIGFVGVARIQFDGPLQIVHGLQPFALAALNQTGGHNQAAIIRLPFASGNKHF